jgi:uncharacterized membrane protein (DUF2068 family)
MDWSLRGCSRQGHATYAPDEPALRARLHSGTAMGEAWRCLRCGTFVLGAPRGNGPAEDAPIVLRGKALREAFILRILAVERWIRAFVLALLAAAQTSLQAWFEREIPRLQPLAKQFNYNLDKSPTVRHLRSLLHSRHGTLHLVEAFLIGYALLQVAEGVGLWSLKRWGEYIAAVGTSIFLPLEIYELTKDVTWLKLVALLINLALVVYLVWRKRLFGVRGGRAAFERERHEDSLLEVEASAASVSMSPARGATTAVVAPAEDAATRGDA